MAQKIQNKINLIIKEFQDGNLEVAEKLAINFKDKYPKNDFGWRLLGIIYANTNRYANTYSKCICDYKHKYI